MIGLVILTMHLIETTPSCDIDLAADDRLYPLLFTFLVKLDCAVHNSVIGDRRSCLSDGFHIGRQLLYAAGTVKQTVFGMKMQMHKSQVIHLSYFPPARGIPHAAFLLSRRSFSAYDLCRNVREAWKAARQALSAKIRDYPF